MRVLEFVIAVCLVILLGGGILGMDSPGAVMTRNISGSQAKPQVATTVSSARVPSATPTDDVSFTAAATPTQIIISQADKLHFDLEDVVLLEDAQQRSSFDINFCLLAEFYGLNCKRVDLNETAVTAKVLRNSRGKPFVLIGISAVNLLRTGSLVDEAELGVLKAAVETNGSNLFLGKLNTRWQTTRIAALTDETVGGEYKPEDTHRNWMVSKQAPEVTREFTGMKITGNAGTQDDFAIALSPTTHAQSLIVSTDDTGKVYPLFVKWQPQRGAIFLDAGEEAPRLDQVQLRDIYTANRFSGVIPLMLAFKYAAGDEAWHNETHYANLTIDDPALTEPYEQLSFPKLLAEMQRHDFHTTIAFVPKNFEKSQPLVTQLFRAFPERFSLVQHGNNHDGYEFYKYTVAANELYEGAKIAARPLSQQTWNIQEGLARMLMHSNATMIPFDRIMIFPYGIAPLPTLEVLKRYNYLATVNGQDAPLETARPKDWAYGMYPAELDYASFPVLPRRGVNESAISNPDALSAAFDFFLDKPALLYSHADAYGIFARGANGFDATADAIRQLDANVEWRGLGYIVNHLYLCKTNDDASIDVRMYAANILFTNNSDSVKTIHFSKRETLNVPIARVTINGQAFPYRVVDDLWQADVQVPAHSEIHVVIEYKN